MQTTEPTIKCPKCKNEIKLTESLAGPLLIKAREDFDKDLVSLRKQITITEHAYATQTVAATLEGQRRENADLQEDMRKKDEKLAEAQQAQAAALKEKRQLAEDRRELELTIERRISEGLSEAGEQALELAEHNLRAKVNEREQTINSMKIEIENLTRKAEQASQQTQGEVEEIKIEETLRVAFPPDEISPVPKGEFGGDILQNIMTTSGAIAGTILWEVKHTKAWMDSWLPKLRADQQVAKAHTAALVTTTLPKNVKEFGCIEGVWVLQASVLVPVAMALRSIILETYTARTSSQGVETKAVTVYKYLTGPNFKLRMQAIVEAFSTMSEDLLVEKKAITRQWAKRETQINMVMQSTVGMYGDLQGIAGKTLPAIKELEISK